MENVRKSPSWILKSEFQILKVSLWMCLFYNLVLLSCSLA
jgi:hypothetical protein